MNLSASVAMQTMGKNNIWIFINVINYTKHTNILACNFFLYRAIISTGLNAGRYTKLNGSSRDGEFDIKSYKNVCCRSSLTCPRYTDKRPITLVSTFAGVKCKSL